MDIKVLEDNSEKFVVELKNTTPSFANAIRRIIISEIPVLAIEEVEVKENNSALQDELLAHRLGLIPLKYPVNKVEKLDGATFSLKKEGPCIVKAEDIVSDNKEISVLYPNIPVVVLAEKQELDLRIVARVNKGKEHAKWQGGIVGYKSDESEKNFVLEIESCSAYTPKELFRKSLEILRDKANSFAKEFEKLK